MREKMLAAMKNPAVATAMKSGTQKRVLAAFREAGVECSVADLTSMFTVDKYLSQEELENVSGGTTGDICGDKAATLCIISVVGAFAAL